MTDLLDPIVQAIPVATPTLGAGAATESVPRSKHVQLGQQRTFDPDTLLEVGVGRAAAGGAVVGFLLFTGFWGGLGFGAMVGALIVVGRDERRRAAAGGRPSESP